MGRVPPSCYGAWSRPAARVLNSVRREHQAEANVTQGMSESIFSWPSLVTAAAPPRDPNDDEDDEEDGGEDDDREPAVIREPDED